MKNEDFPFRSNNELHKRAARLASKGETPATRRGWRELAEEAAARGDWVLSEYAYKRGLGLRALW
ncbi:MAG: hypothetical protein ACP5DY_03355 [Thermovirgaceae bacterium]